MKVIRCLIMVILSWLAYWRWRILIREAEVLNVFVDFKIISENGAWRMSTICKSLIILVWRVIIRRFIKGKDRCWYFLGSCLIISIRIFLRSGDLLSIWGWVLNRLLCWPNSRKKKGDNVLRVLFHLLYPKTIKLLEKYTWLISDFY